MSIIKPLLALIVCLPFFVETFRKKISNGPILLIKSIFHIYNRQTFTCIKNTVSPVLQALHYIPTSTRFLLVSFFQLSPVPLQPRMVSLFRFPTNNFGSRPSPNSIMDGKVIQLSHLKVTKQSKHMQAIQVVSGIKLALQNCFFPFCTYHRVMVYQQICKHFLRRVLSGLVCPPVPALQHIDD